MLPPGRGFSVPKVGLEIGIGVGRPVAEITRMCQGARYFWQGNFAEQETVKHFLQLDADTER